MKIFTKKGTTQKIILIVIIAILWNFVFPTFSRADLGGLLFDPIANIIMSVLDVVVAILQTFFYNGFTGTIQDIFQDYKSIPEMTTPSSNVVTINASDLTANLWDVITPGKSYHIPTIQYSVDKIFAGQVPAFDINFINPSAYTGYGAGSDVHIAAKISGVVASWYTSLRNLAIVILLSVLAYIGIRIVISSSADDRAKYKQRVLDWLIAMCLIFFMHYIMNFTISMINIFNNYISTSLTAITVQVDNTSFTTNLMGLVRFETQYKDFATKVTYMIFYIALVIYTAKYSWAYLKRTITLMFLTVIAPLVAMTYPIDKIKDGKSQAFDAWLKEYVFTALLQPFHLIVYAVLVGSSIDIVKTNPLFAILVIAFIGPAEKMLRKFFGFDKAPGASALSQAGAMFGGAAAWNMTKKAIGALSHRGANPGGGNGGNGGNNNVRTAVENSNAPDSYGDYGRALNPGNGNNNGNNTQGNNREQQAPEEEGRAYLPPEEERESQPQDPDNWDYNDMYLNPENYSDDYASANAQIPSTSASTSNTGGSEQTNRGFWQRAGAMAAAPFIGAGKTIKDTWSDKYAGKKWIRTIGNGAAKGAVKLGKGALKFAGKAAVAGTVGAIGVGMGIAGDDLDDVLKYGAAGGALGYSIAPGIGSKISEKVTNTELARNMSTAMAKARYGSVEKAELAKQEKELRESGKMRQFVMDNFRKDGNPPEGKELADLEDRAIQLYQNGFTDNKEIKRVMKLDDKMMQELNGSLPAEDIKRRTEVIGKMAREIKPEKLSNEDYVNEKIGEFEKGFKNANFSEAEAKSNAKDMMNNIKKYYKKP